MKKQIIFILCTGLLLVSLFGCTNNIEQTTLPDESMQMEQVSTQKPTPTLTPTLKPSKRPSLDEIADYFYMSEEKLFLIEAEELWQKMHIQIAIVNGASYAIIGDIEKTVSIGWGIFWDYKILDIDEDMRYEMVGYYYVGSGISRSIPFVLKDDGEYFNGRATDKIIQRLSNGEEVEMPMYYNLKIAEDGKTLFADARPALSGQEYSQLEIYYKDGKYIFELS